MATESNILLTAALTHLSRIDCCTLSVSWSIGDVATCPESPDET